MVKSNRGSKSSPVQSLRSRHASYLLKDGPLDVIDFKVNSNAREGCEDVGEEDDAVGLERVPRLEGDFNNQLGGL